MENIGMIPNSVGILWKFHQGKGNRIVSFLGKKKSLYQSDKNERENGTQQMTQNPWTLTVHQKVGKFCFSLPPTPKTRSCDD